MGQKACSIVEHEYEEQMRLGYTQPPCATNHKLLTRHVSAYIEKVPGLVATVVAALVAWLEKSGSKQNSHALEDFLMMQRNPYLLEMKSVRICIDEQERREMVSEKAIQNPMEDT